MTAVEHMIGGIFGLIAFFGFIGVIYPTPLHKKLKITSRWWALAVWLVASVIAAPLMGLDKQQNTPAAAKPAPAVQAVSTKEAAPKPAAKPEPKPAPAPAPKQEQWTKILEFTGDQSNSPSDRFQLTGGDVKMEWEITPENSYAKDMVVMGGFLDDSSTNSDVDQFLANMGQTKGEWKLYGVPAGTYYFKPNTANGHWKVTIYEMK